MHGHANRLSSDRNAVLERAREIINQETDGTNSTVLMVAGDFVANRHCSRRVAQALGRQSALGGAVELTCLRAERDLGLQRDSTEVTTGIMVGEAAVLQAVNELIVEPIHLPIEQQVQ